MTATRLLVVVLIVLPFAGLAERFIPEVWQERLALPVLTATLPRHTPRQAQGVFLPPRLTATYAAPTATEPLLLAGTVEIPADVTFTIPAGTHLFAHEFARLVVKGRLIIAGTPDQPVQLTTNEQHPANQWWSGLVIEPGGVAEIRHAQIEYAYPGITCLSGSTTTVTETRIRYTSLGAFVASDQCAFIRSLITSRRHGIISVGPAPRLERTTITASREALRQY
jgi:hypothetical protein